MQLPKVDPLHLKYFKFSGRMMALAVMHKVQVGIVLDCLFVLQLTGIQVILEDIRDADPFLYSSCRQILEMDAEFIDSDALGLTFVTEIEELGLRKVIELYPQGKSTVVNSKNRSTYTGRHLLSTMGIRKMILKLSGSGRYSAKCRPNRGRLFYSSGHR
ncbi:hypothetical protein MLD38_037223 [Melastoma candidum]|uniref:Uncharacterized protein n=1 Tax=Melastoma candidum TaxID=119954 RepID=A0ACB9LN54_9MYRT|nr:hypothetical protein MLD38_037223 [Melastoma candidum]